MGPPAAPASATHTVPRIDAPTVSLYAARQGSELYPAGAPRAPNQLRFAVEDDGGPPTADAVIFELLWEPGETDDRECRLREGTQEAHGAQPQAVREQSVGTALGGLSEERRGHAPG